MKTRRKRLLGVFLTVVLLPVFAGGAYVSRQIRQDQLNRALIAAIKKRNAPTAISLLEQGADANTTDQPYKPVTLKSLFWYFWSRPNGSRYAIDANASPTALMCVYGVVSFNPPDTSLSVTVTFDGNNSMDLMDSNKKAPEALISALLDHGARLDTRDKGGDLLLSYACMCNDAQTVKILLGHHIDPNTKAGGGLPVSMYTDDYECLRLLLVAGADVNACGNGGRTRLMYVRNTKLYPLLFAYGANPNAQDEDGQTALIHLFVSVYLDDTHIHTGMRALLQQGARASLKDKKGKTALDYAKEGRANWMSGNGVIGGRDAQSIQFLEQALKREQAQRKD
jgi:hypothetical protein